MPLTKKQIEAAFMLFNDEKTDDNVAAEIGVDSRTIRRWKENPEFTTLIDKQRTEFIEKSRVHFLGVRETRLAAKMERHRLLNRIIKQRAASADPKVPGADTGLLIKRTIQTKEGTVEEYRIDHVTLRELSRLEADIAHELGQHLPPEPEKEENREKDLSCLTKDELEIMLVLTNKIDEHNPWCLGPCNQPTSAFDYERNNRLIKDKLAEPESQNILNRRTFPDIKK